MRKLDSSDVQDIEYLWHIKFNNKAMPKGGLTELWYQAVCDYQEQFGDDVITKELREAEASIIERGLAKEYFSALLGVVQPPEDMTEEERVCLLIAASPADRLRAVKKVMVPRR